jgi:hypothetical protein
MTETWTYVSPTSISITGDLTAKYWANQRVKFVQNAVTKYFVIKSVTYGSPNTVIVLKPITDNVVEDLAITNQHVSWLDAPRSFPYDSNGKGAYSVIVYIDGSLVMAEDSEGAVIASGVAGSDDSAVITSAFATGLKVEFDNSVYNVSDLVINTAYQQVNFNWATLKAKAGASWILKTDNVNNVIIRNLKLDLNNVASIKGLYQSGGWYHSVDNVSSNLSNVAATAHDIYIDSSTTGAYVSSYHDIAVQRLKILGTTINDAVTTFQFHNLDCRGVSIQYAVGIAFYKPVVQACTTAFDVADVMGLQIFGPFIETVTNYINAGSNVAGVWSVGGNISGTNYVTGTLTGRNFLNDTQGTPREDITDIKTHVVSGSELFDSYIMPAAPGDDFGRQMWYGAMGSRNSSVIFEERFQAASASPLIGRYEIRVNRGDQILPMFVLKGDKAGFGGNIGDPVADIETTGSTLKFKTPRTISTVSDSGTVGEICWDSNYIYVCVGSNSWKRTPISTWP